MTRETILHLLPWAPFACSVLLLVVLCILGPDRGGDRRG